MPSEYIFDLVERTLARLPWVYDQPRIRRLVEIVGDLVQDVEDTANALIFERFLDSAVGAQLDAYGVLLGESRNGLSDADYRSVLKVVIIANRSAGQHETLVAVLRELLELNAVQIVPVYPAGLRVQYVRATSSSETRRRLARIYFFRALAAGVGVEAIVEARAPFFAFADAPDASGFNVGGLAGDIAYD